ncbi:selenium cofactor biosynthesis protein YqeC, partial [Clostridium sp.]|uniref:selenium cofactor biosynthesis protein YqeC n=1 Tax=Clostridium sp. TaxID=1506 RepID=UPI0030786551
DVGKTPCHCGWRYCFNGISGKGMGREAAVMDWEQKFPFLREKGHVVSLIGGGGKTTLLYALSAYCTAKGWRVLTTTTTHIRKPVNVPWIAVNEEENTAWENAGKERDRLWQQGTYVVAGTPAPHEKLTILPESIRSEWISDADITFLEADGAKCLPCKFPAAHEPVILPQSDIVLAVAGLSALYRPLGEVCFRAEQAIEAWNRDVCEYGDAAYPKEGKRLLKEVPISKDTPLTPELLAWLLGSENGARKDISGRSFFVVLNQADTSERREDGRKVLDILKHSYGIQGILTSFSGTERNQE